MSKEAYEVRMVLAKPAIPGFEAFEIEFFDHERGRQCAVVHDGSFKSCEDWRQSNEYLSDLRQSGYYGEFYTAKKGEGK